MSNTNSHEHTNCDCDIKAEQPTIPQPYHILSQVRDAVTTLPRVQNTHSHHTNMGPAGIKNRLYTCCADAGYTEPFGPIFKNMNCKIFNE